MLGIGSMRSLDLWQKEAGFLKLFHLASFCLAIATWLHAYLSGEGGEVCLLFCHHTIRMSGLGVRFEPVRNVGTGPILVRAMRDRIILLRILYGQDGSFAGRCESETTGNLPLVAHTLYD